MKKKVKKVTAQGDSKKTRFTNKNQRSNKKPSRGQGSKRK